jgi:hypothetical protein
MSEQWLLTDCESVEGQFGKHQFPEAQASRKPSALSTTTGVVVGELHWLIYLPMPGYLSHNGTATITKQVYAPLRKNAH